MAYTTIDDPESFFNTVIYTGDGNDDRTVTGVGFSPDLTWLKSRSETEHHTWNDTVRGVNKQLYSNLSYAEGTDTDRLKSFDSDGFTLGTDVIVNKDTETFVSWNWLAGSNTANTDGDINSTVSVNTTSGFSICSWTHDGGNSTIGHGLGAIPEVIITKERNNSGSWNSYFASVGNAHRMVFNGTNAKISSSIWNSTTPTSSVFTMNDSITSTMIAWCFTPIEGYSNFGAYTGNGNDDGVFIYTGFKPAWVLTRQTNGGNYWHIHDNRRNAFNVRNTQLKAGNSAADETPSGGENSRDFLSNGFKFRDSDHNNSAQEYLYMAFAENPFVNSNGVPNNAE